MFSSFVSISPDKGRVMHPKLGNMENASYYALILLICTFLVACARIVNLRISTKYEATATSSTVTYFKTAYHLTRIADYYLHA